VTTKHERLAVAWARVASIRGNADAAVRLLKSWYQFTLARSCYGSAIALAVELARVSSLRDESNAACHYMRRALRLGHGQYLRTFLDHGPAIRQVLGQLLARNGSLTEADREYGHAVLQAFSAEDALHPESDRPSEPTPSAAQPVLSQRELEILELAADDLGNRAIGERLSLSENTVKWYWRSIFTKLQVHRRVKAVSVARAGGMIS
jgi:LuxR family maltose regulon positive regulatory protein/serine/threonine-protein kinase PknK